ncbi:UxaA family hydrolase [Paenibacillus lemnae]|uniref:Altronate dehydratase n=1 Tax=Paenibacillus lemnae TaxID=1330551 RepID=A0A848M9Q5_PAELE|nr:altronate dehydratase family protein [Paenibacillus lemnae]NMO96224.1 altronate dehydratase [Paenibacillus lemnae]
MNETIILHPGDSVAVALHPMAAGSSAEYMVNGKNHALEVLDETPKGHKIAIRFIASGEPVMKFGYPIGVATCDIPAGTWVHSHNLKTGLGEVLEYEYQPVEVQQVPAPTQGVESLYFEGYQRENGEVGIRNEIWILNTVGCINKSCELLAKLAHEQFSGSGIDGVYHFAHPYGCSQLGDDLVFTQKLLASLAHHGNAAGILVVGLGCENNQIESFRELLGDLDPERVRYLKSQDVENEIDEGMELIAELAAYGSRYQREKIPFSKLKIGLKCGGSDGLSGITANPLAGRIADTITGQGGTALMTEVPEMFGAETIFMNRAVNETLFHQVCDLVNDFKQYFVNHGQPIYENPSPGNKDGGITTLEEKSLGCTQKGGQAAVTGVLQYGQRSTVQGLNLIQGPGNDLVSVTALAASGAHLVLFTTGRGTPFGGPVPTVKISTNSELARRKKHWIDFNAGALLEGNSMDDLHQELVNYIIDLSSGTRKTANERNGFREIAIFKDGVTL